jgi:hypothetical protein
LGEEIMEHTGDPMALWVGSWQPEDVVDRDLRALRRSEADDRSRSQSPADSPPQA